MLGPKYGVRWIQRETCKACGFESNEQYTFRYFTPEDAMEQALFVLTKGHTLVYVEQ